MKKFWAAFLIFIFMTAPINSYAMQAPLNSKGKSVYLSDNTTVSLVSYLVFLRVRTGFTSANTSMVMRNENTEEPVQILMGIPIYMDNATKIRDLSVVSNNQTLKYYERNTLQNTADGRPTDIKKWYVWEITLEPGESKLIECAFSIDNKTDIDGTKSIDIPLRLLESWAGHIDNVQIIADLDFYPPYVFEPNPSIIPVEYDRDGRLTWKFKDVDSFTSNLNLYFRPIDSIITSYLNNKLTSNEDIKKVLDLFKVKNYHGTIQQINQLLSAETNSEIASVSSELKFLRAICYQELFQLDKALEQYSEIENNVGFGETLSNTIRNKIIYEKSSILKNLYGEEKALAYLNGIKSTIKNNEVFLIWLNDEIKRMTPTPPEVEEPETDDDESIEEEQAKSSDENKNIKIVDSIDILGYKVPIEIALGGAILVIIILLLIMQSRKRRRRNRYNIFR
jgi:hypothetical protein